MNNEKMNRMIDEAYERYWNSIETSQYDGFGSTSIKLPTLTKEEFMNKCKTDSEFSERWGLKIEERELDMMERWQIAGLTPNMTEFDYCNKLCDEYKVPTKLITVTYNNETIESYE